MSSVTTSAAWQRLWDDAQPRLEQIRSSIASQPQPRPRVLRISQLDAESLDRELGTLLKEPVAKALALVKSTWATRFDAELSLCIHLILYKLSAWDTGATYGAKLQGLRYASSKTLSSIKPARFGISKRTFLAHGALTVLVPYLHTILRAHALSKAWPDAPSSDRRRKAWELLTRVELVHAFLALANFVAFLWNGRYRALADRMLRLRLVPTQRTMRRDVSYEFMNRQMVWHAFTEFLLFLLPLINLRSARRRAARLLSNAFSASLRLLPQSSQPVHDKVATPATERRRGRYYALPPDRCAICAENASYSLDLTAAAAAVASVASSMHQQTQGHPSEPAEEEGTDEYEPPFALHTPYVASCGHTYCYVCLCERVMRAMDEDDAPWQCLRCDEPVRWITRTQAEVVPQASSDSDADNLTFDERDSVDDYEFSSMSDVDSGTVDSVTSQSENGIDSM